MRFNYQGKFIPSERGGGIAWLVTNPNNLETKRYFEIHAELAPLLDQPDFQQYRLFMGSLPQLPEWQDAKSAYCCFSIPKGISLLHFKRNGMSREPKFLTLTIDSLWGYYDHPLWALMNTKYFFHPSLKRVPPNFRWLPGSSVLVSDKAKGPLYFMTRYKVVPKLESVFFSEESSQMWNTLYLPEAPVDAPQVTGSELGDVEFQVIERVSGRTRVEVTSSSDGFLVFADPWTPNWHVYVDGVEKQLLRAYGLVQAVVIGRGTHEVIFHFKFLRGPWGFFALITTLISFLTVVFMLIPGRSFASMGKR